MGDLRPLKSALRRRVREDYLLSLREGRRQRSNRIESKKKYKRHPKTRKQQEENE